MTKSSSTLARGAAATLAAAALILPITLTSAPAADAAGCGGWGATRADARQLHKGMSLHKANRTLGVRPFAKQRTHDRQLGRVLVAVYWGCGRQELATAFRITPRGTKLHHWRWGNVA